MPAGTPMTLTVPFTAAMIAACEDGLKNETDPGAPTVGSSSDSVEESRFGKLPLTLGDAITAFDADPVVKNALGDELSHLLIDFHTDEWARFCGTVTEWERATYWDDLP